MNYCEITSNYYSKWLGKDNILDIESEQCQFIYSSERNKIQLGYTTQYDLILFYQPNRMIVSYGNKILPYLENLKRQLQELKSLEEIKDTLNNRLEKTVHHNLKFVFDKLPTYEIKSVVLKENQYYEYLEFFKRNNPNCENTDWLEEYFIGMTKERTCCGFFLDKTLVSCTDSPCMPYMSDAVQEIGINTIEDYRGRGYATDACVLCAQEIVKSGKCPQWSTSAENVASQKLARKVGFIKFADVLTVTL